MDNFLKIIEDISLSNKYTKWYISIIRNSTTTKDETGYTEMHHIVPKSFSSLLAIKDIHNSSNLAELTAREHYVCHRLLARMFIGMFKRKMAYAEHRLACTNAGESYVSSRQYELIRKRHANSISGEGNPMFGKMHSDITKLKMSAKAATRIVSDITRQKMSDAHLGENNIMFGKTHTEDTRKKISTANKGIGLGENNNFYGKVHSKETKERLSDARKSLPKLECIHCKKLADAPNHKRWHGDNCRFK